ncbi:MAG: PEP-CTERM sorting domain-containing protein [Phycisphaeraceae bacterium]|nr:PEP-CTERM sorting domain-containing protein [Phycisphaeraceae bacterium]
MMRTTASTGWRWAVGMAAGGVLALAALGAGARPYITLGPTDILSLDQPRVTFGLVQPGTNTLVGPTLYNSAALDTGANGVLLAKLAYVDDEVYVQATRGDGTPVYYDEMGVAGSEWLAVLKFYDLIFEGSNTNSEIRVSNVRALASPTLDIGGFAGIVGMPAMTGRVTTLDLEPMSNLEFIDVAFSAQVPASRPDSYHVGLSTLALDPIGQLQPGDPLPTMVGLPMIDGIRTRQGGLTSAGRLLLDTGAQNVILSPTMIEAMGIDWTRTVDEGGDVVDELEVGGIGGFTLMPMVYVDQLVVPTSEGVDLIWTDVLAGVLDLGGLDGVLGMNVLTSGYLGSIFGDPSEPYLEQVVLDFRQENAWNMRLDLNPAVNVVTPNPDVRGDFNGDGVVTLSDINPFKLALTDPAAYAQSYLWVDLTAIDPNADGVLTLSDIHAFKQLLTAGPAAIPEPAALALVGAGLAVLMGRRRWQR